MNLRLWILSLAAFVAASLPTSSNYSLGSYGFGTGGTAGSSSSNYAINGIAGDAGGTGSSTHYKVGAGANNQQQADVPLVTLTNPFSWYNKLLVTITPNGNPTDAKYAIAVSPDAFATTTYYVKSDFTLTSTYNAALFQTYTFWGGSSGFILRGLNRSTIYSAQAAAQRGKFTQSAWGPVSAGITTDDPSLSFEIDISATDVSTSPPYVVNFGNLLAGSVTTAPVKVWVTLDTNAESGGMVYVQDQNAGLTSANLSYTLPSVTTDISTQNEGYGAQSASATQSSGGPLVVSSPFNGSAGNVGALTTGFQQLYSTTAPVTAGRASFNLKAKTYNVTPASADYADLLTLVAAAAF